VYFTIEFVSPETVLQLLSIFGLVSFITMRGMLRFRRRIADDLVEPLLNGIKRDRPLAIRELEEIRQQILAYYRAESQKQTVNAKLEQAERFAHDILSPLRALQYGVEQVAKKIDEISRIRIRGAIQRIQDIASHTLSTYRRRQKEIAGEEPTDRQPYPAASVLEEIASEKRIELSNRPNISIRCDTTTAYGIFVGLEPGELKRILSNCVNNAVEAYENGEGVVHLNALMRRRDMAEISVTDLGKGIPAEVLNRLGQPGVSHGKETGNGLGVYHCIKTLEAHGGRFVVESTEKRGTTVRLLIPALQPPAWFLSSIRIKDVPEMRVIILDDEPVIHEIWKGRFRDWGIERVTFIDFPEPGEFRRWFSEQTEGLPEALYLIDFEFIGCRETGLDIVEEFNLGPQSVLVTSHYQNPTIRQRCLKAGAKLLPKVLIDAVSDREFQIQYDLYDAVHIDASYSSQLTWRNAARRNRIKLLTLTHPKELEAHRDSVGPNTAFYVGVTFDCVRQSGVRFTQVLYEQGFRELYLTRQPEADLADLPWIKGIADPLSPWY
jgi:signal transduction histidine kinase